MKVLNRAQIRLIDEKTIHEYGLPGVVLMENAGRGIAGFLLSLNPKGKVIICCEKGNNGGDGYVIARYLSNQHIDVQVIVFAKATELKDDAKTHYDVIKKMGISIEHWNEELSSELLEKMNAAEWVVDGLFGTGLNGKPDSFYLNIIHTIQNTAKVLAIDIPSGLDCDTGKPLDTAIKADFTCTLIALKKGFIKARAKAYLGDIKIIEIGIPRALLALTT